MRFVLQLPDPRRRRRRTRKEIEEERERLRIQVEHDIDAIVAEMHILLPRERATAIGVAYARYSTEFQHSVGDQIRSIFEHALKLGIIITRELIFYDLAEQGCKERRPGLEQVQGAMRSKLAKVLLVFTTNRLYRKLYKATKFVEEEIVGRGLRCVFLRNNIDTAETDRWRIPLQIHAMLDEMTSSMYASNIRAAHEGLFELGYVVTTLPYGYMGQDVPGAPLTKRKLTRQMVMIDPELSGWVKTIFQWFVLDSIPKCRILELLNAQGVPCGPKSDGTYWTDQALTYLLTNACYRGWWSYGRGKNVWQNEADYSKRVLREKPLREKQFEDRRIVSDEIWFRDQEILANLGNKNAGRKPKDRNTKTRPRILNGLLYCTEHHESRLKVAGDHGQIMLCMRCRTLPKAQRPLYSQLNRALALKCICNALAAEIRKDCDAIGQLMLYFRHDAEQLQVGDTRGVEGVRARSEKLTRQIQFIQGNPGETEADRAESAQNLKVLRSERAGLAAELARPQSDVDHPKRQPTEQELQELLANLERVLLSAALGNDPVDAGALRALIEMLTGGRIVIEQMGERRAYRGWLRARFRLQVLETCASRLDCTFLQEDTPAREIVVDIREE